MNGLWMHNSIFLIHKKLVVTGKTNLLATSNKYSSDRQEIMPVTNPYQ
jgi:hypothetical protein